MTTPALPFTPARPRQGTSMRRWLLGGSGKAWQWLERRPLQDVWAEHAAAVVRHFIKRDPGRRPYRWWQYSAPEPRRRLGGIGSGLHECSAYALVLAYGVPAFWRRAGDFMGSIEIEKWPPIDPANPPTFESESAYLARHKLFLPGERKRLRKADFLPEKIEP
jgi:hypothetical protein